MFLTANALANSYGIDDRIAKFYVDREPPANNLYWKDKLLYMRPQPGYLFLPLITDLFFKSGISLELLLSDKFVDALEAIGHFAAEQEAGIITKEIAVDKCYTYVITNAGDHVFANEVATYLKGGKNQIAALATSFRALHRGDYFLFCLCILSVNNIERKKLISTWFALITSLLLMDDAEDIDHDREHSEENAFVESGEDENGFRQIKELLFFNLEHIKQLNVTMANALHRKFTAMTDKPFIKQYLNI